MKKEEAKTLVLNGRSSGVVTSSLKDVNLYEESTERRRQEKIPIVINNMKYTLKKV